VNRIFLDLDGVVRDWVRAVAERFHVPELHTHPDMIISWDFVESYVCGKNGLTPKQFWEMQDETFWLTMHKTKEANQIIDLLLSTGIPVCLLTSPTLNNAGWSQKWMRENMPSFFYQKHYLIGPAKHFAATPDSLLVDDAEKNINMWVAWGGIGLLFPRPWNSGRQINDPMEYFKLFTGLGRRINTTPSFRG
jgi:hypothetical protein